MNKFTKINPWHLSVFIAFAMVFSGCSAPLRKINNFTVISEPTPPPTIFRVAISPTPFQPLVPTFTLPPPPTATPAPTKTPTPTLTPSATPTATWVFIDPGKVTAPILLYHHIDDISPVNRYYVSPENFRKQMQALKEWGYTTITPTYLSQIIL